jgi:hypothetical protein
MSCIKYYGVVVECDFSHYYAKPRNEAPSLIFTDKCVEIFPRMFLLLTDIISTSPPRYFFFFFFVRQAYNLYKMVIFKSVVPM